MKKALCILFSFSAINALAWQWWPLDFMQTDATISPDSICYQASISGIASYGKNAPFMLYSHSNGDISTSPFSGNINASISKQANNPNRWFDYDFAIDFAGRFATDKSTAYFRELYAHLRLLFFDIRAGITPTPYGAQNNQLSSGGLLFANSAHPLPAISIGIDNYTAIPGTWGYAQIKGAIRHAWVYDNTQYTNKVMIHHKYAGMKLGGTLPINISYEFHHAAQWGGFSPKYGNLGNDWQSFKNTFFVRAGGSMLNDQLNAQGNHIIWQQFALDFNYHDWKATAYWQALFEDKSINFIGCGTNNTDGLWGITISQTRWNFINCFTYEFLNTTNQSGPFHDRDGIIYAGRDNYFNNSIYLSGWTYHDRIIGNPYIQTSNNRVRVHYVGISGDIYGYKYALKCSYAKGWGTYFAPTHHHNTAILVQIDKHFEKVWDLDFGIKLATDIGNQYGNSFAGMLTITKKGLITRY